MKVIHLNNADSSGGAARAAFRIHQSLLNKDLNSKMWVNFAKSGHWTVTGPEGNLKKGFAQIRRHLIRPALKVMKTKNNILHSPAILPSAWSKKINLSDADLVHLHWVGAEMASVADIGSIKKPLVWTLHDMWAFCGAEHISWDERWREGYTKINRPYNETGFDINRWTWKRKLKHWKKKINIVTPSKWLAECAKNSVIMKNWPVSVIPNCLNTNLWKPVEKILARKLLGLPQDVPIIAFGSLGANYEHHKGFDLLFEALKYLKDFNIDLQIAIFGQHKPKYPIKLNFPVHYTGFFYDDISLRLLYSSIDILIVPSRKEAFGQIAMESMACSTPVVAFGTTGLLDIVDHKINGYLAKPFKSEDLANGIKYILNAPNYDELCHNARQKVVKEFDNEVIAKKYVELYNRVLK
jgi:glycosyltransferase involved in cell wall biosynthesis